MQHSACSSTKFMACGVQQETVLTPTLLTYYISINLKLAGKIRLYTFKPAGE